MSDALNERFGGVCGDTGEAKVDLNLIDPSLEGVVTESVVAGLFSGDVDPAPYRVDAPESVPDEQGLYHVQV